MIDVSLIPKKEGPRPFSLNKLFSWISLLILILSIGAGGFVVYALYSSQQNIGKLNLRLQDLDKEINSQQDVIQFAQSAMVADQIISSHKYPSKFMDFLEKNTSVFIQWTGLSLDLAAKTVALDGTAHDLLAIAQQMKQLENLKLVSNIKLGSVTTRNNQVSFKLTFALASDIFSY